MAPVANIAVNPDADMVIDAANAVHQNMAPVIDNDNFVANAAVEDVAATGLEVVAEATLKVVANAAVYFVPDDAVEVLADAAAAMQVLADAAMEVHAEVAVENVAEDEVQQQDVASPAVEPTTNQSTRGNIFRFFNLSKFSRFLQKLDSHPHIVILLITTYVLFASLTQRISFLYHATIIYVALGMPLEF
ncbi:hypothetical protein TKK_0013904 [Trichogramma kaykai]